MKDRAARIGNIVPPQYYNCFTMGMFIAAGGMALAYVGTVLMLIDLQDNPSPFIIAGIRGAETIRIVNIA
jgi:hypothetical protein